MKKIACLFFLIFISNHYTFSQTETFPYNGIYDIRTDVYALTNATIISAPGQKIEQATLLVRNGWIEKVGKNVSIPKDAVVVDMQGKWIYPSFIELFSEYGLDKTKNASRYNSEVQMESNKKGAFHWNQAIRADYDASAEYKNNDDEAKDLRGQGFGTLLTHKNDGIVRGTASLVMLGNEKENLLMLKEKAATFFSLNKGSSTQDYPSSLMGSIALLKQTFLDALWYKKHGYKEQVNISLEKFNSILNLPLFFDANDKQNILRVNALAKEFNKNFIIKGNGTEYQILDEIKATGASLIIPINFPKPYDVDDVLNTDNVPLSQLKHWEMAPFNCHFLSNKDIPFAITSAGLQSKSDFRKNILKLIKAGSKADDILNALTLLPARMLQVQNELGTIESGKRANFFISSNDYFKENTILYQHWINGKPYHIKTIENQDISGKYNVTSPYNYFQLDVSNKNNAWKAVAKRDTLSQDVDFTFSNNQIQFSFPSFENKKITERFYGWVEGNDWQGNFSNDKNNSIQWTAKKFQENTQLDTASLKYLSSPGEIIYPFTAYGNQVLPNQETYLFKNATVWTNEKEGILRQSDVLVRNGKIVEIGQNINSPNAIQVNCTGKHLTSGIIDEHSHIAIQWGVNEGTQASTAEVSIGDVVDSDDVSIYRSLAGGVTACQLLHGSANPIGGQSALIKLRWGFSPEKMKIKNADGFIKFALGENVKQSNWGDKNTIRFPQTRMGVEQVFVDHFTRAKIYQEQLAKNPNETRRDLEMDALSEILNKKRFITCHSYVQSEITMLMRVAEKFNFNINTFTHILEGFKVADKMKTHGVGASTFSDWWAYKMEVYDCTPYNAAILHEMDVVTAINSDDAEMSRRLNQEAAKTIKYGKLSEEEAWKTVTLNPAILLHLDKEMGSIKVGKDADLVLWSDNPLSIYAQCEKTLVDGICFYDKNIDVQKRKEIAAERNRIIQKMLLSKKNGEQTQKSVFQPKKFWHCDDLDDH